MPISTISSIREPPRPEMSNWLEKAASPRLRNLGEAFPYNRQKNFNPCNRQITQGFRSFRTIAN
jgi:hypothetical protein